MIMGPFHSLHQQELLITHHPSKKGLILAKNALADIEDIDRFIDDIYQARGQAFERKIHL